MSPTLAKIGEFGLIKNIQKKWGGTRAGVLRLGIGDDAAVLHPSPGKSLLLTTDILIEGVHCDFSFSTFFEIGYKALSVNVSDIAAMGGRPHFFLVSLGLSGQESVADVNQLYRGMARAGREMNLRLIGGNTARAGALFFVSITLLGEAGKKEVITRSGGRAGDFLYVTGALGDAAAGLEILKRGERGHRFRSLVEKQTMPKARWKEGRLLAQKQIPSAMIDLSDGLSSDLVHLADQSDLGAELQLEKIPISRALKRYAKERGADPMSYALHGGEDYELLFSVPEKKREKLERLIQKGDIAARSIGRLVEKGAGLLIKDREGQIRSLIPGGYDHLRRKRNASTEPVPGVS